MTVGTITRGYAEARRRGLLSGEVGRGTFVRSESNGSGFGLSHAEPDGVLNLGHNSPHFGVAGPILREAIDAWSRRGEFDAAFGYGQHAGHARHRRAGAQWIQRSGLATDPGDVVVTAGAQHAMMVALGALVEPGDLVLAEELEYPGMKALARLLRIRLEGVTMDAHGIVPAAFETACQQSPKALYCSPTIQNPTATVLTEDRRRDIAAIADRHGVAIVEDDTYGFLVDDAPPPLTAFVTGTALYITSLSKSVLPGLRIGYLRQPAGGLEGLESGVMTSTIMASPLTADLAATLIDDGTAERVVEMRRREAVDRQDTARRILGPHVCAGVHPHSSHLWLSLPEPWRGEEFAAQAKSRGIAVAPAEVFAVGRTPAPHAVRLSLGTVIDNRVLERGLDVLAELLASPPAPSFAGV